MRRFPVYFLTVVFMTLAALYPAAAAEFQLNGWREINRGEELSITQTDLNNGMLEVRKTMPPGAQSMDISMDGGTVWDDMVEEGTNFLYRYRPVNGEVMNVAFSWLNADGSTGTLYTDTSITFNSVGVDIY